MERIKVVSPVWQDKVKVWRPKKFPHPHVPSEVIEDKLQMILPTPLCGMISKFSSKHSIVWDKFCEYVKAGKQWVIHTHISCGFGETDVNLIVLYPLVIIKYRAICDDDQKTRYQYVHSVELEKTEFYEWIVDAKIPEPLRTHQLLKDWSCLRVPGQRHDLTGILKLLVEEEAFLINVYEDWGYGIGHCANVIKEDGCGYLYRVDYDDDYC